MVDNDDEDGQSWVARKKAAFTRWIHLLKLVMPTLINIQLQNVSWHLLWSLPCIILGISIMFRGHAIFVTKSQVTIGLVIMLLSEVASFTMENIFSNSHQNQTYQSLNGCYATSLSINWDLTRGRTPQKIRHLWLTSILIFLTHHLLFGYPVPFFRFIYLFLSISLLSIYFYQYIRIYLHYINHDLSTIRLQLIADFSRFLVVAILLQGSCFHLDFRNVVGQDSVIFNPLANPSRPFNLLQLLATCFLPAFPFAFIPIAIFWFAVVVIGLLFSNSRASPSILTGHIQNVPLVGLCGIFWNILEEHQDGASTSLYQSGYLMILLTLASYFVSFLLVPIWQISSEKAIDLHTVSSDEETPLSKVGGILFK